MNNAIYIMRNFDAAKKQKIIQKYILD